MRDVAARHKRPSTLSNESPGPVLHRSHDDDHFWLNMLVM